MKAIEPFSLTQRRYNPGAMTRSRLLQLSALGAILTLSVFLAVSGAGADSLPAPRLQPTPFPTPTPNERGEIIYIVQEGDTPWRIAALAEITIEELYALNGLQSTDFITPGMRLLLGSGGPPPQSQPTLSSATEAPASVTATPEAGSGEICALLFLDENGDAQLQESEPALAGGQVSIASSSGEVVGERATVEEVTEELPVGVCFADLPEGAYNVSAAVPAGYNPTTAMNTPVDLRPGEVKYVEFGAQPSSALGGGLTEPSPGRSPILGAVGLMLLLAAGGLGYYAARMNRKTPRSLR